VGQRAAQQGHRTVEVGAMERVSAHPALHVLVVDDERRALTNLQYLVMREPDVRRCEMCDGGAEAVERMTSANGRPDIVFLDVQMPEVDGFDVVRRVGSALMPPVIFVTAHDAWAVRAFEVNAVDYLLKPVADERFALAMRRARSRMATTEVVSLSQRLTSLLSHVDERRPEAALHGADRAQRIAVRDGSRSLFLDPREIDWISAEDYCIHIFTKERAHLVRCTLAAFADKLDPARFARVHRSAVVNVDRIREIKTLHSGKIAVCLMNGHTVPVSRARVHSLQALLRTTTV
jgi:two-component system LytT family response regulator